MSNLNKVFLMGYLTRDPELKYATSNIPVVNFGIAINRRWITKDGEQKESACFVEIGAFSTMAETIGKYFKKGSPIFIEGRLQYNQWTTQDGQKRNTLRVIADNFQFIGGTQKKEQSIPEIDLGDIPDIDNYKIPF